MNKISNDKIKKNLIRKFNKNPILRMKPEKKKEVRSSQACGSGWLGMPRP
jgi:hypothetical protein